MLDSHGYKFLKDLLALIALVSLMMVGLGIMIDFVGPFRPGLVYLLDHEELPHYRREAMAGDAKAAFKMYQHYAFGDASMPWSERNARYYLTLAARLGHRDARINLGYIYSYTEKNYDKALYWYKKAAKQGSAQARINIKRLDREIDSNYYFSWTNKMLHQFVSKAQEGDSDAALKVSEYYNYFGEDKPRAEEKEIKYLSMAAELGNPEAKYWWGFYNEALFDDYGKALIWYEKAAKQSHSKARERLRRLNKKFVNDKG